MLTKEHLEEIQERVKAGDHGGDYFYSCAVDDRKALLPVALRSPGVSVIAPAPVTLVGGVTTRGPDGRLGGARCSNSFSQHHAEKMIAAATAIFEKTVVWIGSSKEGDRS